MSLGNQQYFQDDELGNSYASGSPGFSTQTASATSLGTRASGLALAGVITTLVGIWGALIPFIGPTFGYSADGATSWRMTSAHLWLALIPGVVAFVSGLWMLLAAPRVATGSGKRALSVSGLLAVIAGAWFVIGPLSWPAMTQRGSLLCSCVAFPRARVPGRLCARNRRADRRHGAFTLGWRAGHEVVATTVQGVRRHAHSSVVAPSLVREPVAPAPQPYAGEAQVTNEQQQVTTTDQEIIAD